jgi:hypothetical protein
MPLVPSVREGAAGSAGADKVSKACYGEAIKLADEVSAWIAARDAAWRRASASKLAQPDGW